MGNSKPVVEAGKKWKKKKKGRPSLLDLQKRSLRLQKLEQEEKHHHGRNPNPSPNPYLRFPNSTSLRRSARRNPDAAAAAQNEDDDEEEEEEEGSGGRRKEKKLRLVLRLPGNRGDDLDSPASGSDSDARRKRRIDAVGADGKTKRQHSTSIATDPPQEPSDSGPTTPLPDKKLLVFILDRLQKKDTYGVFSEPVDPEELPDYHDIIKHPMDFATLRKNLANGAYANLEQFEKDVFLISSNAMRYNAPDTIYYRQARAIQELAKKNFENLRQESDDNEAEPKPEPKPVRRGRPPTKNILKKVGRPPVEHTGSDFSSSAALANSGIVGHWSNLSHDLLQKGPDKSSMSEVPSRPYGLRTLEARGWSGEFKSERNEDYSGLVVKGNAVKYGKKLSDVDENRRMTYKQTQSPSLINEPPVLMALAGERKQLVPVGLQLELAYARSLARFAANLGPIGWEIAAKRIERILPPGTNFGRGWVGDNDMPQPSQPILPSRFPPHSSKPEAVPSSTTGTSVADQPSSNLVVEEAHASTTVSPPSTSAGMPNRSVDPAEATESLAIYEGGSKPHSAGGGNGLCPRPSFQLHQNPIVQTTLNGFNNQLVLNQLSQGGKIVMPSRLSESFGSEAMMTHSRALDMVSRNHNSYINHASANHFSKEKAFVVADQSMSSNSNNHLTDSAHDPHALWRDLSLNSKRSSLPPDLNVGLQSPGSPTSRMLVDSQQADLALQL